MWRRFESCRATYMKMVLLTGHPKRDTFQNASCMPSRASIKRTGTCFQREVKVLTIVSLAPPNNSH